MHYYLIPHARLRVIERKISTQLLEDALHNPTKILYDNDGRLMIKRLYRREGKERLLLIIAEPIRNELRIITLIDTSKVKKYL